MPDNHTEIELKFDGSKVDTDAFIAYCDSLKPCAYKRAGSPDKYYTQGPNVVRHRLGGGAGELTVKQRKTGHGVVNRCEVDLHFAKSTSAADVEAFLEASGWEFQFALTKKAHIFWYEPPQSPCKVSVVIYDVARIVDDCCETSLRRFIEVEVEKGEDITDIKSEKVLAHWQKLLSKNFKLGKPLKDSLYEIYSGHKYATQKKHR